MIAQLNSTGFWSSMIIWCYYTSNNIKILTLNTIWNYFSFSSWGWYTFWSRLRIAAERDHLERGSCSESRFVCTLCKMSNGYNGTFFKRLQYYIVQCATFSMATLCNWIMLHCATFSMNGYSIIKLQSYNATFQQVEDRQRKPGAIVQSR